MSSYLEDRIINKILDNLNFAKKKGMIIASPSNYPPYKFHWIRDSALVMRVFIDLYAKTKNNEYFKILLDYIENENYIQNLNTITGLGEPKMNIDGTPYNEPWGRPQNDGPALRGINMIKIFNILKEDYSYIVNSTVKKLILNDLNYILENYDKPSFDLWEEYKGWHFYTRLVQLKFLKECIKHKNELGINKNIKVVYKLLLSKINHHMEGNTIISSFDENGNVSKKDDASILLAFSHISYDTEILKYVPLENGLQVINNLLQFFRKKYNIEDLHMVGRYANDKYFDGHIWFICTLGIVQYYSHLNKLNPKYKNLHLIAKKIFDYIISVDINLDLAEQYDPVNNLQLSAEKLTWNYSELYISLNNL